MSDKKESLTPKVTRTNSVFPASKTYQTAFGQITPGQQPILPVVDPRSNQVIGYRDMDGHQVDKHGTRLDHAYTAAKKAEEERKAREARLAGIASYQRDVKASRVLTEQPMTVDGVIQRPFGMTLSTAGAKVDANGKVTDDAGHDITKSQLGAVAAQQSRAAAVFSGLNLDNISPSQQFVMSYGSDQTLDPATGLKGTGKVVDDMNVNRRQQERTAGPVQPTQNLMTIQEGVRWLRQLSVKDPGAYNEMVVKLRNASYLNGKDEDLPLNGWSNVVGQAFAYAAADLAGAAQEGETRTMAEWLDARGKAFADSMEKANAYKPVDRHYTDPAALAASARSAAEQVLGRGLTDEEAARFASTFRGLEDANYNAIDAAGRAKGSATVTDPNAAGQAEAFVRSPEFNGDRAKQLVGSYMDSFKSLMGL